MTSAEAKEVKRCCQVASCLNSDAPIRFIHIGRLLLAVHVCVKCYAASPTLRIREIRK